MNYSKEKKIAIKIAKQAGREILKFYKKVDTLEVDKKNKHEIVTPADFAANKVILKAIKKNFPKHGILSEETGQDKFDSEFLWVIDPLDGTTNFSIGNHFFNTSIALVHKQQIILGVTWAPFFNQLFVAEKGKGAFVSGDPVKSPPAGGSHGARKIKVSKNSKSIESMVNFGYTYRDEKRNEKIASMHAKFLKKFEHAHNLGAAALELAWVAMGRLEAYILPHSKPWDIAAGILMVREAGGKVTDFEGKPYKFITSQKGSIIASNGLVHKEILKVVDKI